MNKLTVSLTAIAANYHMLQNRLGPAECAAVVKANGYGLGALPVADKLQNEGCKRFFVATVEEGILLRKVVKDHEIYIFHGAQENEVNDFIGHNLTPVLNNPSQLMSWPKELAAAAHFDTGMTRLGFSAENIDEVKTHNIKLVMSHLASAENIHDSKNVAQLAEFQHIASSFPNAIKSFANSYGVYLQSDYHFNLARPGIALYGGNPLPDQTNPMSNVVKLEAPIIQIHEIQKNKTVGYCATYEAKPGDIIATIPLGYADGILRALSNRGKVFAEGYELPIVGRISMDLVTIKINNLPPEKRRIGQQVEVLGEHYNICDMARDAATIEYEIITRLGNRFERVYK